MYYTCPRRLGTIRSSLARGMRHRHMIILKSVTFTMTTDSPPRAPPHFCVSPKKSMDLPQRPPPPPLPRLRFIGSCPKCEKRLAASHHQPTWLVAISGAAHPPSASALRSLFVSRACRCSFSQSKGDAAATTACLLPRAISPPMQTALFFCLASADRICHLRHFIIVSRTSRTSWPTCRCHV